ncbi:Uncharacterized protein APZ42_013916 [Daphnia magna]|uniref:Uncharacterized protein n=1 Tax=Daphnia magna TaxID=35525 RepID=A0A162QDI8_9CRUS|nr:Uncharacterized protein APZ42_013916 [Daphnia magna]
MPTESALTPGKRHIPGFDEAAKPLLYLTREKSLFIWTPTHQEHFDKLKQRLADAATLAYPDPTAEFEIHPDACGYGVGAVLLQKQDGAGRPLAFASRLLSRSEQNYSITEKECLALIWVIKKFRQFIFGSPIRIVADHHALCWLQSKTELAGRLARWAMTISEYKYVIAHKDGKLHQDADALSRYPVSEDDETLDNTWAGHVNTVVQLTKVTDTGRRSRTSCRVLREGDSATTRSPQEADDRPRKMFRRDHDATSTCSHGDQSPDHHSLPPTSKRTSRATEPHLGRHVVHVREQGSQRLGCHTAVCMVRLQHEQTGNDRHPVIPVDTIFWATPDPHQLVPVEAGGPDKYEIWMLGNLQRAFAEVDDRSQRAQRKYKQHHDTHHREGEKFHQIQQVLVYRPTRKVGLAEKLLHRWHGPYSIVRKITPLNYEVQLNNSKKTEVVHVERLKSFVDLTQPVPNTEVGAQSTGRVGSKGTTNKMSKVKGPAHPRKQLTEKRVRFTTPPE